MNNQQKDTLSSFFHFAWLVKIRSGWARFPCHFIWLKSHLQMTSWLILARVHASEQTNNIGSFPPPLLTLGGVGTQTIRYITGKSTSFRTSNAMASYSILHGLLRNTMEPSFSTPTRKIDVTTEDTITGTPPNTQVSSASDPSMADPIPLLPINEPTNSSTPRRLKRLLVLSSSAYRDSRHDLA